MKKIFTLLIFITIFFSFYLNLNAISDISVNNYNIIPMFDSKIKVYNLFVESDVEIITINAQKLENEVVTGVGSRSLKSGLNEIEIISYIDEKESDKYILNVIRGDIVYDKKDSLLKNLSVKGYEINFNELVYDYVIEVSNINKLDIKYETNSPFSTVKVSGDIVLKNKENNVNIKVTSGDGKSSTTYKIKVIKEINKTNNEKKKVSFFDNRKFTDFELKLIIIGLIILGLVIMSILFYIMFIKKRD